MKSICYRLIVLVLLANGLAARGAEAPVGRAIADFTLHDYLGAKHSLGDWRDKKAVVIAFLGIECPLAKQYGSRLAELATKYEPQGVAFVGIDANQQDSLAEIAHYAREHKIDFPILKDPGNALADQCGAERTPEVFVVDANRVVRYWGRIDDQYGVGYARPAATKSANRPTSPSAALSAASDGPRRQAMSPIRSTSPPSCTSAASGATVRARLRRFRLRLTPRSLAGPKRFVK
jgi:peroxiredoxin